MKSNGYILPDDYDEECEQIRIDIVNLQSRLLELERDKQRKKDLPFMEIASFCSYQKAHNEDGYTYTDCRHEDKVEGGSSWGVCENKNCPMLKTIYNNIDKITK